MKNCFSKFILAGLLAIAAALPVAAQNIGLYTLVPTGVVALYGGSTNVFLTYVQTNWVGSNPAVQRLPLRRRYLVSTMRDFRFNSRPSAAPQIQLDARFSGHTISVPAMKRMPVGHLPIRRQI